MTVIPEVSVDDLAHRLARGAPLVDVREPDEYAAGHVGDATLVPLGELPARLAELPAGGEVYVICRSGARSARACEFLQSSGIRAINVAGGTLAWVESGREIVRGMHAE